jgi:hypothetical protein
MYVFVSIRNFKWIRSNKIKYFPLIVFTDHNYSTACIGFSLYNIFIIIFLLYVSFYYLYLPYSFLIYIWSILETLNQYFLLICCFIDYDYGISVISFSYNSIIIISCFIRVTIVYTSP